MSNYDNILREKENNLPLGNSDMEKNWAAMETQLNSATQSTSKDAKFNFKKIIKGLVVVAVVCIITFVIFNITKNKNQVIPSTDLAILKSAIKPPMPAINVPYETFTYDAEIGDTLFTQNGSILIFPKNAVLNNKGEMVTGKIEIKTREFNDPLDYYMAGIPMTYDSADVKYTFVSSGMIDIKAYQNNELLFVNPNAKPQLNLVSTNNAKNTNLYILDTTTGQWINKGKDEVNDIAAKPKKDVSNAGTIKSSKKTTGDDYIEEQPIDITSIAKPIPPQKASGKNPTIEIIIDPASFKELLVYNNLKFEVLNTATETVGEDSKTEWDNVELLLSDESAKYFAKFSKGSKSVQYEVKPVLEGKDYDAAVTIYNKKIKAYYDVQKNRIANEQMQRDTLALRDKIIDDENKKTEANNEVVIAKNKITEIENKRIEELNVLIIERNEKIAENKRLYQIEMKKQQKISDSVQKIWEGNKEVLIAEIKKQKQTFDSLRLVWERDNKALVIGQNLIRSFEINGFGYWNCDQPTLPNFNPIYATFVDNKNKVLNFASINEAIIGINRLFVFPNNKISVLANANHVFWATFENKLYYFTANDYNKLQFTKPNNATFVMRKYEGELNNIEDLRKVLYGKFLYGS
jgi:hypothetical protein